MCSQLKIVVFVWAIQFVSFHPVSSLYCYFNRVSDCKTFVLEIKNDFVHYAGIGNDIDWEIS